MGKSKFPPEIQEYIKEHVKDISARDLADMVNEEFGTDYTGAQIRSYKKNNGLKSGKHYGWQRFPRGLPEYMQEIIPGRSSKKVAEMVNEKFGEGTINAEQVLRYKKNHHLHSGLSGQWPKGHPSPYKGMKQEDFISPEGIERSKATRFKKGNIPWTRKPVGTITRSKDGYLWIKFRENQDGTGRDGWEQLQRYIWRQHNGPIPEGSMVIFLDGNKENCDISNLAVVTKAEHIEMMRSGLRFEDADLTETGVTIAKLKVKTREKGREDDS